MPGAKAVLASASEARAAMLEAAGVSVTIDPARIDESAVKAAFKAEGRKAAEVAEALAALKAQQVSRRHPDVLVIGADQILDCEGRWFDKPASLAEARDHLMQLRDRTHELVTAVCVVRDGEVLWHHVDRSRLTVRAFSDSFLTDYLNRTGDAALTTVGGYQVEGLGAQLFTRIEGDHFSIVGLPLLPLLTFLRDHEMVAR